MSQEMLEQGLQRFKESFQKAVKSRDRRALEEMLHANYSFVGPEGNVFSKQQLIENIVHPTTNFMDHNFKRTERRISISDDGDTVTEVADVDFSGDLIGEDKTGRYVNTATYVKGARGWQILGTTITKSVPGEAVGAQQASHA
jgi:ketosteroid isomerase-like protein